MNIFTYIQHLYTAFVLCKCVLTYIFSNYYKINKEGRMCVCLESDRAWPVPTVGRGSGGSGSWLSTAPENILLLAKMTSFQLYKSLHVCRFLFQLFTPLIHIYKWRRQALEGKACLLSVGRFLTLPCPGTGRHAHSCFNAVVYVWKLRQARFVRHGVRRKHRVIP